MWLDKVFSPRGQYYAEGIGQKGWKSIRDQMIDAGAVFQGDHTAPNGGYVSGNALFVTPQGTLYFNLAVFSVNAFFAIQHLLVRRRKFGGELGGPKWGFAGQYFSACWLVFQWVLYITFSSIWVVIQQGKDC